MKTIQDTSEKIFEEIKSRSKTFKEKEDVIVNDKIKSRQKNPFSVMEKYNQI